MTTPEDLVRFIKENIKNKKFVAAIQREPYIHSHTENGIVAEKAVGGGGVLIDGIMQKTGGLMVAVAAGNADADVIDSHGRVAVPPGEEKYTLKRIFLSKQEMDQFYYGFANQTLWPLCHSVFVKPIFRPSWWKTYVKINQRFANAILSEIKGEDAFVWINDYHLALVPSMLREKRPSISIGIFWHIPWATPEIFRICPWRREILEGMLGADFIGFHRHYQVENFIDCLREEIGVIVESEPRSVLHNKRLTKIAHLPSGIDTEEIDEKFTNGTQVDRSILQKDLGIDITTKYLILGVDRVDYTKGLIERLLILDRLFEKYPEYRTQVTYVSIGVPSRIPIPAYKTYNSRVHKLVDRINAKYQRDGWQPIYFIDRGIDRDRLFLYYRLADVGLVTPLDDGMNLVAKEFVISAKPDKGILVLSRFAGAAKDLDAAMLINPYDTESSVDALRYAINMTPAERIDRNRKMRISLEENNIYRWGIDFIKNTTTENLTHKYL